MLDVAKLKTVAIEAIKKAGEEIVKNFGKVSSQLKSKREIITQVDTKAEKIIYEIVKKNYPEHTFYGEEIYKDNEASPYKWWVDPLDGTNNYAYNYPFFCSSIGISFKNTLIIGVVYDPFHDELFEATCESPAKLNGKRIKVTSTPKLNRARLLTGFYYEIEKLEDNNLGHFQKIVLNALGVRVDGTAALDLCQVACGRADGYWEIGIKPWDTAAGKLIVEKAGGKVSNLAGGKYNLSRDNGIVATNKKIHSELIAILKGGFKSHGRKRINPR
jgi:myo-inositol-1(or 4)-monophosphatase